MVRGLIFYCVLNTKGVSNLMRHLIKRLLLSPLTVFGFFITAYATLVGLIHQSLRYVWMDEQLNKQNHQVREITHLAGNLNPVTLRLYTPNWLCRYRAETFSSKEPETLKWIDDNDGVLFDIGANIGLYSMYHAKTKRHNVYAFEPSFFNLPLLSKNINSNDLQDKVSIISNPLSDSVQFADFKLASIDEGGALSAFGVDFDQNGDEIKSIFSYKTLGYTLDFLFEHEILTELPAMIKVDVDGIEHLILSGAKETLRNPICKTVLIEVNDNFSDQADETARILFECGFSLKEKYHQAGKIYNQIWVKS